MSRGFCKSATDDMSVGFMCFLHKGKILTSALYNTELMPSLYVLLLVSGVNYLIQRRYEWIVTKKSVIKTHSQLTADEKWIFVALPAHKQKKALCCVLIY